MAKDWYEHRNELRPGQVFTTQPYNGAVVKLDQRTPGDGTRWDVLTWSDYGKCWSAEGNEVEPGDLADLLPDNYAGEAA